MKYSNHIFIHALSQRCGHNFLSKLIRSQIKLDVLIHDTHEVIIPGILAYQFDNLYSSKTFVRNKKAKLREIELAANAYIYKSDGYILKTSLLRSKHEIDLFPSSNHIVLIRHPQDLFTSYEKSIYSFRKLSIKARLKKIIRPIYSYYVLNKWAKQLNHDIEELKRVRTKILVIKYESLLDNTGQKKVFDFLNIKNKSNKPIEIQNINSSFADDKNRWNEPDNNVGDPTKRFESAPKWLKIIIRKKLKESVLKLNYQFK